MNDLTDQQLLQAYSASRTEAAFAELVRRHVDFVHSAALRMVRDAHLAQDITQGVFVALAQNARQVMERPTLSGWLHRTAQNLAANVVRSDVRRRAREQEAFVMNELLSSASPGASWEQIAPELDTALGELNEPDRDALLLRYFEKKSAREMAQILGVSDEAAQKRVTRAIEHLRDLFSKRNVTIGSSGLAILISANAIQAAPAGLVTTIAATALAGTATTSTLLVTKTIAMTTFQKTLVTGTIAVLLGTGIYQARTTSALHHQVEELRQQQTPLVGQIRQLRQERDAATNELATLAGENKKLSRNSAELFKLRGQVASLQTEKNLDRLKTKLADVPAGMNVLSYANAEERRSATNAVTRKAQALAAKLGLTSEQAQSVQDILLGNVEARVALEIKESGGNITHEDELLQLNAITDQENQALATALTSDQMAAYQQANADQTAANRKSFASHEAATMQNSLELTSGQAAQVASILAALPPGEGGPGFTAYANAPQQLETRLNAFASVLTSDQLAAYRQQKLADIAQTAAEKSMAQQAYKALSK